MRQGRIIQIGNSGTVGEGIGEAVGEVVGEAVGVADNVLTVNWIVALWLTGGWFG